MKARDSSGIWCLVLSCLAMAGCAEPPAPTLEATGAFGTPREPVHVWAESTRDADGGLVFCEGQLPDGGQGESLHCGMEGGELHSFTIAYEEQERYVYSLQPYNDGSVLLVSYGTQSGASPYGINVERRAPDGSTLWRRRPGAERGPSMSVGTWSTSAALDDEGNAYVVGSMTEGRWSFPGEGEESVAPLIGHAGGTAFFVKYSPDGKALVARSFPNGPGSLGLATLLLGTTDGRNLYVIGRWDLARNIDFGTGPLEGLQGHFLARFGPDGTIEWLTHLKERKENGHALGIWSLHVDRFRQQVVVTGTRGSNTDIGNGTHFFPKGESPLFIARYGSERGQLEWARHLRPLPESPNTSFAFHKSALAPDGTLFIAGNQTASFKFDGYIVESCPLPLDPDNPPPPVEGCAKSWLMALEPSGRVRWVRAYSSTSVPGREHLDNGFLIRALAAAGQEGLLIAGTATEAFDLGAGHLLALHGQPERNRDAYHTPYIVRLRQTDGALSWARRSQGDPNALGDVDAFAVWTNGAAALAGGLGLSLRFGDVHLGVSDTVSVGQSYLLRLGP